MTEKSCWYVCNICKKLYASSNSLWNHNKNIHDNNDKKRTPKRTPERTPSDKKRTPKVIDRTPSDEKRIPLNKNYIQGEEKSEKNTRLNDHFNNFAIF